MINARKINDEFNICEGITGNMMFLIIWIIILVVQILLTQFTKDVFECNRDGLSGIHWLISLGFAAFTLLLDVILKLIPDALCPQVLILFNF